MGAVLSTLDKNRDKNVQDSAFFLFLLCMLPGVVLLLICSKLPSATFVIECGIVIIKKIIISCEVYSNFN